MGNLTDARNGSTVPDPSRNVEPPPWYTSRNPTRRWLHLSRSEWVTERLRAFADRSDRPCGRILEVGSGSGHYLAELSRCAGQVIATEVRPDRLPMLAERARELTNVFIVADDVRRTALRSGSFDVVLCSEVIEHMRESLEALRSMRAVLRDDGRLILTTPQRYSVVELMARVARYRVVRRVLSVVYGEQIEELQHINLLTARRLKHQLLKAGFAVVEEHFCGLYIPLLAECGGTVGQRIAAALDPLVRRSWLRPLLWTQCYLLVPAGRSGAMNRGARDSGRCASQGGGSESWTKDS